MRRTAQALAAPPFARSVFVNCPFDDTYKPILDAILFAIHDCGFIARVALEETGTGETRLDKIARIIQGSCFSIHDISRVEITAKSPLPRFNMPFECGLAVGAQRYAQSQGGAQRDFLLLTAEIYQDKLTLSDLAGQDPSYHSNEPAKAVAAVRKFLASKERSLGTADVKVRGAAAMNKRLTQFQRALPARSKELQISVTEINSLEYLTDWLQLAAAWIVSNP